MKKILVPVDGSPTAQKAAIVAVEMAEKFNCEITFFSVAADIYTPQTEGELGLMRSFDAVDRELLEQTKKILDDTVDSLGMTNIQYEKRYAKGAASEQILKIADLEHYDLIVMGRRGLSKINRFFVGSVTQRVLSEAPCSVLIVKE